MPQPPDPAPAESYHQEPRRAASAMDPRPGTNATRGTMRGGWRGVKGKESRNAGACLRARAGGAWPPGARRCLDPPLGFAAFRAPSPPPLVRRETERDFCRCYSNGFLGGAFDLSE